MVSIFRLMRRYRGTIALAAGLWLAPAAGHAQANQVVRFTVQPGLLLTTLIETAVSQKFFAKEGIDPRTVTVASGPAAVTALASGSVDVATNAPEVFLALAGKGQSLQLIAGQTTQLLTLMTRPGLSVPAEFPASVAALKGKSIGVTSNNGAEQHIAGYLVRAAGLQPSDVRFVVVGNGKVPALANGVVDSATLFGAQVAINETLGGKMVVDLRQADSCPPVLREYCGIGQIGMWATGAWVAKNPETVTKIRRAISQADVYLHDPSNKAAVRAMLATHLPADSSDALKDEYVSYALSVLTAAYAKADLARWIVVDQESGVLPQVIPVASVYAEGTPETEDQVRKLAQ
jgi:NitT/TauT family transport system substrate-binding protein